MFQRDRMAEGWAVHGREQARLSGWTGFELGDFGNFGESLEISGSKHAVRTEATTMRTSWTAASPAVRLSAAARACGARSSKN